MYDNKVSDTASFIHISRFVKVILYAVQKEHIGSILKEGN